MRLLDALFVYFLMDCFAEPKQFTRCSIQTLEVFDFGNASKGVFGFLKKYLENSFLAKKVSSGFLIPLKKRFF